MTTTTPSLFQKGIKLLTITCCEFPGDVKRLVRHGSHKQSPRFHRFPFPGSWGPKPSEDNFDFQLCTFAFETCWDMEAHNQRGQEKVFQNSQVPGSLSVFSSDRQNSVLPPSYAPPRSSGSFHIRHPQPYSRFWERICMRAQFV